MASAVQRGGPELFTLDEDGYSDIGQGKPVPAGKEDAAEQGVEIVQALSLERRFWRRAVICVGLTGRRALGG